MKKTKLLMPLLGLTAAAGLITPVIASCSRTKTTKYEFTVIEDYPIGPLVSSFSLSNNERKDGEDLVTTLSWTPTTGSTSKYYLDTLYIYANGKSIGQNTKTNDGGYVVTGHGDNSISLKVPEKAIKDVKSIVFLVTLDYSQITERTKQSVWTDQYKNVGDIKYDCLHSSETISIGTGQHYVEFEADLNKWKGGIPDNTIYIGVFDSSGKRAIQSSDYFSLNLGQWEIDPWFGEVSVSEGFIKITIGEEGWGNKGNLSVLSGYFQIPNGQTREGWEVVIGVQHQD